jgi:hypothetical protein
MLGTADFTATTGTTVVLASGATTGDLIRTESFYVSSVLNALPTTGGTISGNLVVTGTETVPTITSPAATALTLQANNGTTGLTVNSNGMVSTPLRPAFFVGGNGGTIATGQVIPWNVSVTNTGTYFNTSTYRFVAPIAGTYVFTMYGIMGVTGGVNTQAEILLRKNGSTTLANMHRNMANSNQWEQGSVTVIVVLAVSDYIDTYTYAGTIYLDSSNYYSGFSGYLLS